VPDELTDPIDAPPADTRMATLRAAAGGTVEEVNRNLGLAVPTKEIFAKVQALWDVLERTEHTIASLAASKHATAIVDARRRAQEKLDLVKDTLDTLMRRYEPQEFSGKKLATRINLFKILWEHVRDVPLAELRAQVNIGNEAAMNIAAERQATIERNIARARAHTATSAGVIRTQEDADATP